MYLVHPPLHWGYTEVSDNVLEIGKHDDMLTCVNLIIIPSLFFIPIRKRAARTGAIFCIILRILYIRMSTVYNN